MIALSGRFDSIRFDSIRNTLRKGWASKCAGCRSLRAQSNHLCFLLPSRAVPQLNNSPSWSLLAVTRREFTRGQCHTLPQSRPCTLCLREWCRLSLSLVHGERDVTVTSLWSNIRFVTLAGRFIAPGRNSAHFFFLFRTPATQLFLLFFLPPNIYDRFAKSPPPLPPTGFIAFCARS